MEGIPWSYIGNEIYLHFNIPKFRNTLNGSWCAPIIPNSSNYAINIRNGPLLTEVLLSRRMTSKPSTTNQPDESSSIYRFYAEALVAKELGNAVASGLRMTFLQNIVSWLCSATNKRVHRCSIVRCDTTMAMNHREFLRNVQPQWATIFTASLLRRRLNCKLERVYRLTYYQNTWYWPHVSERASIATIPRFKYYRP